MQPNPRGVVARRKSGAGHETEHSAWAQFNTPLGIEYAHPPGPHAQLTRLAESVPLLEGAASMHSPIKLI